MPGGDRTGSYGAGPMTGRGAGLCAGYDRPGYANPVHGRGYGGGCGRGFARGFQRGGRGWRNQYYATGLPGWARGYGGSINRTPVPPAAFGGAMGAGGTRPYDVEFLKQQARYLKRELEDIEARLSELQRNDGKSD